MVRSIVAVLVGLVIGTVVIFGLESVGHLIYPPPEGVHGNDPEEVKKVIANMPVAVFLFVLLSWAAGNCVGGFLAAWVARRSQAVHALLIGVCFQASGIILMLTLPHPVWFWVASFLVSLPPAYLGSRLAPRPPSPPRPGPAESLAA